LDALSAYLRFLWISWAEVSSIGAVVGSAG